LIWIRLQVLQYLDIIQARRTRYGTRKKPVSVIERDTKQTQ
jgi:hypothetical protein